MEQPSNDVPNVDESGKPETPAGDVDELELAKRERDMHVVAWEWHGHTIVVEVV